MKKKILFWTAILLGVVNIFIGIGSVIFARLNGVDWLTILADAGWILALSMTAVGVLIAVKRPDNPLGWIFSSIGFFSGLETFALQFATFTLVTSPASLPGGEFMSWLVQTAYFPAILLFVTYAILLYPTGQLPSSRWQIFGWICAIPLILFLPTAVSLWPARGLVLLLHPERSQPATGLLGAFTQLAYPMMLLCGLICVASLFIRYRKADLMERRQIKWVAFSAAIFVFLLLFGLIPPVAAFLAEHKLAYLLINPLTSIALPAAVGMAILRYRLWEIDILINRTLVYVPLTGILAGLYGASISLLQRGFVAITGTRSDGAVVLTTLILTSTFTPIKNALQSLVDRRFKSPTEPLAALKTFDRQIQAVEQVVDRESAARRFLDESVSALQASCGAVFLSHKGRLLEVSTTGDWEAGRETLTVLIGKEKNHIGTLYLGPRRDGTPYIQAETTMVAVVAGRLGKVLGLVETA
jgi:hypothetical protein